MALYRKAPRFAPAGQSTQLIVGATRDTDRHILHLTESLYRKYRLKRVFYSAYVPVVENALLPSLDTKPPLLREHRLYQADWLLRFYGFKAQELLDETHPDFNPLLDPKCHWALCHLEQFPVEIRKADLETLLRVPGIGPVSARRIVSARRHLRRPYAPGASLLCRHPVPPAGGHGAGPAAAPGMPAAVAVRCRVTPWRM